MKRIIHKLAIETPVIAILLVTILCCVLIQLCSKTEVDKYLEVQGVTQKSEDILQVTIKVKTEYFDGIKKYNKVIWYEDLDSAVYEGKIINKEEDDGEVLLYIDLGENDVPKNRTVTLKISYGRESIVKRLF